MNWNHIRKQGFRHLPYLTWLLVAVLVLGFFWAITYHIARFHEWADRKLFA